jgi:hypothetical protein
MITLTPLTFLLHRSTPENSGSLSLINPPGFISDDVKEVYIDSEKEEGSTL